MGDDKSKTEININYPQSPYYLCASNNLGNVICPIMFIGDKLAFVYGSITKLESNSLEGHTSERCNLMVIAWLHNIIDKVLHGSLAYTETIKELWSDLKDRYSQGNEICIHQLKRDIALTS